MGHIKLHLIKYKIVHYKYNVELMKKYKIFINFLKLAKSFYQILGDRASLGLNFFIKAQNNFRLNFIPYKFYKIIDNQ